MICSPFTPYLAITIAFNVPLILIGWKTFDDDSAFCEKAYWLWWNSVMAFFHIVGSIYIVYRIQEDKQPPFAQLDEIYNYSAAPPTTIYPHGTSAQEEMPPQTSLHIVGLVDGGEANAMEGGNTAGIRKNSSGDSKEPLNAEAPYHNMKNLNPSYIGNNSVGYPRSLKMGSHRSVGSPRSISSKSQSPFRNIFANNKTAHPQADTIESVASLVAGLPDEFDLPNTLQRIGKVLCYDPGTALYLFVAIVWVVWQSLGVAVAMQLATNNDAYVEQCDEIKNWVVMSTIGGFLYIMLVLFAFGCSLLCLR